jgi:hypothetical protein
LVFKRFEKFSAFDDQSDPDLLFALSNLTLHFHSDLFSLFDPAEPSHWKVALRLISDENSTVRFPCARALSLHYGDDLPDDERPRLELCEYDLIVRIYAHIGKKAQPVLAAWLKELKASKVDGGDSHFQKEPIPFLFPPSFHIQCIKSNMKQPKR